jgi:NADH:ubiquinone oxidoreductase subunit F (NADH-binding)
MNLSQVISVDRYLMEFIPHLLIEGMITSSFALGANLSYLYSGRIHVGLQNRKSYCWGKAAGFQEKIFLGSGFDLELYVHIGAGLIFVEKKRFDRIIRGKEESLLSHHFLQFLDTSNPTQ